MRSTPATCAGTAHITSVEISPRGTYTPTERSGTQRRSSTTPGSISRSTCRRPDLQLDVARALRLVPAAHTVGEREQRFARKGLRVWHRTSRLAAVQLERPSAH